MLPCLPASAETLTMMGDATLVPPKTSQGDWSWARLSPQDGCSHLLVMRWWCQGWLVAVGCRRPGWFVAMAVLVATGSAVGAGARDGHSDDLGRGAIRVEDAQALRALLAVPIE